MVECFPTATWTRLAGPRGESSRRAAHQLAVFIEQIDRDSVDLQLRFVFDGFDAQAAFDASVPLPELIE